MADRWIRDALGREPQWEMGDRAIPILDAVVVMREMPPAMREILIAEGEETGVVVDARKRFAGFTVLSHAD